MYIFVHTMLNVQAEVVKVTLALCKVHVYCIVVRIVGLHAAEVQWEK